METRTITIAFHNHNQGPTTMKPTLIRPFDKKTFDEIKEHVGHIRKAYDWPGIPVHDANDPEDNKFSRWFWHNLPMLKQLHHSPELIMKASKVFGEPVKPSYVFTSLYDANGVCPVHRDRPQCRYTIDLCIDQDDVWPIYVEDLEDKNPDKLARCKPYILKPGEALCYSGTGQTHYRKPMKEDSKATWINLAFFHWVPTSWMGEVK
jgi:hypothetical protein